MVACGMVQRVKKVDSGGMHAVQGKTDPQRRLQ